MKRRQNPVNLKFLAEQLGLSQGTVSMALSPNAESSGVAAKTRERVLRAAMELNYQPNFYARSLSSGRSFTIGILVPAISDGYYSTVIAGIEAYLLKKNYFFLVTSHHWEPARMEQLPDAMQRRGVEGLIVVNTALPDLPLPSVRIGGSVRHPHSTNVRIDEKWGTQLALQYLVERGHRQIAFFRGEPESTAAEERWSGILHAAKSLGVKIDKRRIVQLQLSKYKAGVEGAWVGYSAAQELLRRKVPFTALLAYNDATAIGAMRAFHDARLNIPQEISVMGYDDIPAAEYERPALTTVRQPLLHMGAIAAETLLKLIERTPVKPEILIEPELVLRNSVTNAAKA